MRLLYVSQAHHRALNHESRLCRGVALSISSSAAVTTAAALAAIASAPAASVSSASAVAAPAPATAAATVPAAVSAPFAALAAAAVATPVGLTGLDGKMVQGKRNKGIRVYQGEKLKIVRDFSGKPQSVNAPLLHLLLDNGYVPVLTVPIIDEHNAAINTENDDVVRVLQQALKADTVINLIEAPGFLEDKDDAASLIKKISSSELEAREQQVQGRMKRKMLAVRKLFEHGASMVVIGDGRSEHPVKDALAGKGTVIE